MQLGHLPWILWNSIKFHEIRSFNFYSNILQVTFGTLSNIFVFIMLLFGSFSRDSGLSLYRRNQRLNMCKNALDKILVVLIIS